MLSWIGDGVCDVSLDVAECNFDGGDCGSMTTTEANSGACVFPNGVPESWLGDNICDEVLNNAMCDFDGGDCGESSTPSTITTTPQWTACVIPSFLEDLYGNGECDSVFNSPECSYDGGDCDVSGTSTTEADPDACVIPDGVPASWLGDNYCDEVLNNEMCDFDGGDCSESSSSTPVGVTTTQMPGTSTTEADPAACIIPDGIPEVWLGDSYCDEALNNEMCDFDGGDCVGSPTPPTITTDTGIPEGCIIPEGMPPTWLGK